MEYLIFLDVSKNKLWIRNFFSNKNIVEFLNTILINLKNFNLEFKLKSLRYINLYFYSLRNVFY